MNIIFFFRGDTGSLTISNKTRRIGRWHNSPYSTNSSSQSSDEEAEHSSQNVNREQENFKTFGKENTILDNAPSLLENWVAHNDRVGGGTTSQQSWRRTNNGSSFYQVNGQQIKQNLEREALEITKQNANCLPLRKVSDVENCDESSLSGR